MFLKRFGLLCVVLSAAVWLSACGGSSKPLSITITPSASTVDGGDTVTLTATVTNDKNSAGVSWTVTGGGALSGQTTTSATFTAPAATSSAQTITITATSVGEPTKTVTITLTVQAKPSITTTAANLAGTVGTTYSVTLAASGGIAPYTWTLDSTSAPLPCGFTMTTAGVISGAAPTATCAGTYAMVFDLTDSGTPTPLTATVTVNLVVTAAPAITFGTAPTATGTYNVAYSSAVSASGGAGTLTYSLASGALPTGLGPSNSSTGAITGTPTAVGPFNFTMKAADAFGDSATHAYTITVSQATPTLAFAAIPSHTYGDAPFTVSATSASSGAVTYSVTSGPATISGNTVTITGVGPVVLGASQAASINYTAATASTSFTVNAETPTLVFAAIPSHTYGDAPFTVSATSASSGAVTYSVTSGPATISGSTVTITGAGTVALLASQVASGNYAATTATTSFTVYAEAQTITFANPGTQTVGTPLTLSATASSSLTVSFASTTASVCTVSGTTATMLTSGTCTIQATQAGNASFAAATPVSQSFTVNTEAQSINFANPGTQTVGTPLTLSATASSSLAVSFASTTASVCTVSGTTATMLTSGTCTIQATQAGNISYAAATPVSQSFTVNTEAQTISFPNPGAQNVGTPLTLSSSASSGLSVSFVSNTLSVCTVSGTSATMLTTGTCTIQATQAGNISYAAATPVSQSFTVSGELQTITFPNPGAQTVGTPLTLSATTTATGMTVAFASTTTSVCTVSGTTASMLTSGTCTIQATQAGNSTYAAATPVSQSFTVNGEAQTITFANPGTQTVGTPLTLSASASSSLTVSFASTTPSVCTVSGTTASMLTPGTCTIQATQAGNSAYAAATVATQNFTVIPALSITSSSQLGSGTVGLSYASSLFATGGQGSYHWTVPSPADVTCLNGLGLSLSSNGVLWSGGVTLTSGNVGTCASFNVQVSDSAVPAHTYTKAFSVSVAAISISPSSSTLGPVYTGSSYSQQLTAVGGTGPYTWSVTAGASQLTNVGLTFTTGTATLSGTAATLIPGTATFTVQVTDANNATTTHQYTINVYAPLSLPAAGALASATIGQSYSTGINVTGGDQTNYQWTVNGNPVPTSGNPVAISDGITVSNTGGFTLSINGPTTQAGTITLNVSVTDTGIGKSTGTVQYTILSIPQTPLALTPSPNPLGSAAIGQSYSGAIVASGGSGTGYSFQVMVGSTLTAVPTSGQLLVANGISVQDNGNGTMSIDGTPTTAGAVTINVTATDSWTDTATHTYTIAVGATISGQFFLQNYCYNGNSNLPVNFTVDLYNGATRVQTTTTDVNGNYSFTSIPNGTYTIKPSLAGAATLFYPANPSVTLSSSSNNVTGENFSANVGFTVSGTVSYSGLQTGQTYLAVNSNNCGGNGGPGTSITEAKLTSDGAFTIHGVPPGSNTIQAWMDPLGQGVQNAIDPTTGSVPVTVGGNVSNATLTMADPTFATPSENPTISAIIPNAQGVMIAFNPSKNSNGVEDANQYLVQWSTSSTLGSGGGGGQFATIAGSHTFTATGDKGLWVLNSAVLSGSGYSFTSGTTYFFQARSFNTLDTSSPHPSGWCDYNSSSSTGCSTTSSFTGVKIGTPTCTGTCTAVSSSVTIPAGITINTNAPLYLGLIQLSSAGGEPIGFYFTEITSPVNGVNSFPQPISVPSGSNYVVIGILDQYKTGGFGVGAVSNVKNEIPASDYLTITGSTQTVSGITLPTSNSVATVSTQWSSNTCKDCGATQTSYQLKFAVEESNKLPVAVTLTSGPNMINTSGTVAIDMGNCTDCGRFQYSVTLPGGTPNVGDTYDFTVTYLNPDGTTSTDTGSTVHAAVTGWDGGTTIVGASDAPSALEPNMNDSSSTTPTFTWTDSSSSTGSHFNYSFYLSDQTTCSGNCTIWQIPGQNSKSNGFSSSTTSIHWGTDPTNPNPANPPSVGSLTPGDVYNWQIYVQDPYGNDAQTNVWYQP